MSRLRELLAAGEQVFTAEFPVIDGPNMAKVARSAERLRPWFDAVNATDNPAASAHTSNVATAIAMQMHGLEPILQVVCRDKNRLAIQADLSGASLHGIVNVVMLTGDDVTAGDEPETRRVFDVDGPIALRIARTMRHGTYLSGRKLNPAPDFFIGGVENASAPPFDYRIERVGKKIEAGAEFLQLQICYHPDRLERFMAGVLAAGFHIPVLANVVLVKSARPLQFMNDKVPGIDVPQATIDRVANAPDQAEAAYQLVLEQARHALSLPGVRGLHVTDFRHDETIERLMLDLGRTPRYQ
ncbi:MAG: methylenetetrahydrofolate reductase [Candidatus Nanopelagicales bacterium]